MNRYDEYKAMIASHDWHDAKVKVREIVARKNLLPQMNDAQWIALQSGIDALSFPSAFIERRVIDPDDMDHGNLADAPTYYGDWSSYWEEGLPPFFMIEWLKVRPRYAQHRGRLIAPKILDETDGFKALLDHHHIPYSYDDGTFTIYGYSTLKT